MIRMTHLLNNIKVRHVFMLLIGSLVIYTLVKVRNSTEKSYDDDIDSLYDTIEEKKVNLNELYKLAECLLEEAGKRIVAIRHDMVDTDFQLKSDQSRVTQADFESHRIIMHALKYKYKNFLTIKSEEDRNLEEKDVAEAKKMLKKCDTHVESRFDSLFSAKDLVVWVDPLDATQEYSGEETLFVYSQSIN